MLADHMATGIQAVTQLALPHKCLDAHTCACKYARTRWDEGVDKLRANESETELVTFAPHAVEVHWHVTSLK